MLLTKCYNSNMTGEVFMPGQKRETFSEDFLRGRIVRLNTMLRGFGVMAFERYGNYDFLSNYTANKENKADPKELIILGRVENMYFSQIWDDELIKKLQLSKNGLSACTPEQISSSQRFGLNMVKSWLDIVDVDKHILQAASCNAFLAAGNSFAWEKNPELLAEMTKTVMFIGKAHRDLQDRE